MAPRIAPPRAPIVVPLIARCWVVPARPRATPGRIAPASAATAQSSFHLLLLVIASCRVIHCDLPVGVCPIRPSGRPQLFAKPLEDHIECRDRENADERCGQHAAEYRRADVAPR